MKPTKAKATAHQSAKTRKPRARQPVNPEPEKLKLCLSALNFIATLIHIGRDLFS
jgi:hypothetical protein